MVSTTADVAQFRCGEIFSTLETAATAKEVLVPKVVSSHVVLWPQFTGLLVILFFALTGCGGSSGDPIIRDMRMYDIYQFQIRNDADSPVSLTLTTSDPWTASSISLSFPMPSGLMGVYNRRTELGGVYTGSRMLVTATPGSYLLGGFSVETTTEIASIANGDFLSGAWRVLFGSDVIEVLVLPEQLGVRLQLNADEPLDLGWQAFSALYQQGSTAPSWQQAASASFQFLGLMFAQVGLTLDVQEGAIDASFDDTPLVRNCDPFPASPPAGVLLQGERVLTWLDFGVGRLGTYDLSLTDCWFDRAGDRDDYLYRGHIAFSGWQASGETGSEWLSYLGFGDDLYEGTPGGVGYLDMQLDLANSDDTGGFVLRSDRAVSLSGGFAAGFSSL